jgi:hypothetical protein
MCYILNISYIIIFYSYIYIRYSVFLTDLSFVHNSVYASFELRLLPTPGQHIEDAELVGPDIRIKSAWRPPSMDMYSGCYIQNMDIYIYIMDFGNLGTNVANGSIRILTLDITSRIYIQILVIWVPMLQMDRSEY